MLKNLMFVKKNLSLSFQMKPLIEKIERELIKAELTPDKFLRFTNKGGNEIYVTTAAESPNIMREIGRLREWAFRLPGGGTGKDCDTDEFDYMERPYKQLFVWDPQNEEILGGYRFIHGRDVVFDENGQPLLATSEILHFSDKFLKEYMPETIELGRSFVHPDYQATKMGTKSLFALDNLWDGLCALTVAVPDVKYLFGKVTMYPTYDTRARDLVLSFIGKYFPDNDNLVRPYDALPVNVTKEEADALFCSGDFKTDYKTLHRQVRELGVDVPPLVHAYIGLSATMRAFGAAICKSFGSVIEFGILMTVADVYPEKKRRHLETYLDELSRRSQK